MESQLLTYQSAIIDMKDIISAGREAAYSASSRAMLLTYWSIGKRIVEQEQGGSDRAEYGKGLISALSEALTEEFGKGYSERNLRNFRRFYLYFPDEKIWNACVPNLNWTHIRCLLRVPDEDARYWYMKEAADEGWSSRTLDRNISTQYYYRILQSPKKEEIDFLIEMGRGFAFVARQQHIVTETEDYFIDLVFYNIELKCYVLIDLKMGKITHQDVGQIDMYIRMYDELKRGQGDNPTLGILLCSETDEDIARYSVLHDNDRLFMSKYLTYLPTQEQLKTEIEREKELFYLQHPALQEKGGEQNE